MMRRSEVLGALVILGAALVCLGCGDQITRVQGKVIGPGSFADGTLRGPDADASSPDGSDVGPIDRDAPGANLAHYLTFKQAYGDDHVPCQGTDHCTIELSFNEQRKLQVVYTEKGRPITGQSIRFKIQNDPSGVGKISALVAATDSTGVATVTARSLQTVIGSFKVKVWIDGVDVQPLYFDVSITPKGQVPLVVVGTYEGARPLQNYSVRLFLQDGAGKPDCSDRGALYNGTALYESAQAHLGQSVRFKDFINLEHDKKQMYTVLAFAMGDNANTGDLPMAWGCNNTDALVEWGKSKLVTIDLSDRPPSYVGTYAITSVFDLVSALPPPIDGYVNLVLDIFKNPVGGLLELGCKVAGGSGQALHGACQAIFNDPSNPSVDDMTATGGFISDVLNAVVSALASQNQTAANILRGGHDVSDMLTAFTVNGTMTFSKEPTFTPADPPGPVPVGRWAKGAITETWDGITVKWSLGQTCNPYTNANCGKKHFSINAIQPGDPPISSDFTAHVENFWLLTIDLHPLNVQYGAILNFIIQKVLLPMVFGDGTDGGPVIDSYGKFFKTLLAGKQCLMPASQQQNGTCCDVFAAKVMNQGSSTLRSVLSSACDAIIQFGSTYISSQLDKLNASTSGAFEIGTLDPCQLLDVDNNLVIDELGTQDAPCHWDVELNVFGAKTRIRNANFWGIRE